MEELRFNARAATSADAAGVSAVLTASYGTLLTSRYSAEQLSRALPLMSTANPVLIGSGKYYVAKSGAGQIIACGGWSLERPGTPEVVRGIASAILSRCIRDAETQGTRSIEAYSTLTAVGFYLAQRFVVVRTVDVPLGSGICLPSTLMRLDTMIRPDARGHRGA